MKLKELIQVALDNTLKNGYLDTTKFLNDLSKIEDIDWGLVREFEYKISL